MYRGIVFTGIARYGRRESTLATLVVLSSHANDYLVITADDYRVFGGGGNVSRENGTSLSSSWQLDK